MFNPDNTFECPIIKVGKIEKHPYADLLSLTKVGDFTIVIKTGELKEGDFAVYIPEDSLVPVSDVFKFLWGHNDGKVPTEARRVVRAKKLRGIFSEGLLIPLAEFNLPTAELKAGLVGTNVAPLIGIEKYEKPEQIVRSGPPWFVTYTKIENIKKYPDVLKIGEKVVITEKIHGANARFCFKDNMLWIGSHYNLKKNKRKTHRIAKFVLKTLSLFGLIDKEIVRIAKNVASTKRDYWIGIAHKLNLKEKLANYPNIIFFGEVYGTVQSMKYGLVDDVDFRVFDVYDVVNKKYLDYTQIQLICTGAQLDMVPMFYYGHWQGFEKMKYLSEGPSKVIGASHLREGFVVKPAVERKHNGRRVIFKLPGEEYLLNKGKVFE